MGKRWHNQGQRELARVDATLSVIGAAIGVSKQAVARWKDGSKVPGPASRVAIAKVYGIPAPSWDEAYRLKLRKVRPRKVARSVAAAASTTAATAVNAPDVSVESRLRELLARLDKHRLTKGLTDDARLKLESVESRVLHQLRAVTGEGTGIDESRIVRSAAWKRIQRCIIEALYGLNCPHCACKVGPEGSVAVMHALQELS